MNNVVQIITKPRQPVTQRILKYLKGFCIFHWSRDILKKLPFSKRRKANNFTTK